MKPIAVTAPFVTAHEYLVKRGFANGLADVHPFGVKLAQVKDVCPDRKDDSAFGLAFPHFDFYGRDTGYATIRVFDPPATPGTFASVVAPTDKIKLRAPGGRPPLLYVPRGIKWEEIAKGTEVQVHESVVKCLAAVRKGYIAVGVNGVWGWTSKQHLQPILNGFSGLPWNRNIRLVAVFDSNSNEGAPEFNEMVALAVVRFAGAVELEHHAPLYRRRIPNSPDGKGWGYDDWVGVGGGELAGELGDPVEAAGARAAVDHLNSKICFLTEPSIVVSLDNSSVTYKVGDARNVFAPVSYMDEEDRLKPAFDAWLRHGKRRWARHLDYRPGQAAFVDEEYVNTWKGWGCEPRVGDTSWWDELLSAMDGGALLETSFAWRMQHPMAKPSSLVNFLVGEQGVGKSTVMEVMKRIVGPWNFRDVSAEQLTSEFTDYLESFFLVVDDLGKMERRLAAKVNRLITGEHLTINKKNRAPYMISNRGTWLFTGEHMDSLPMKEGDRRWHVIKMNKVGRDWADWWKRVDPAALFARLLAKDVSGFDPYAPAPVTEGQKEMAEASRNPLEDFIFRELESILDEYGRKCVTSTEVLMLFQREVGSDKDLSAWGPKKASDILSAQHWGKVRNGDKIKVEGITLRFWSRNRAFLSLSSSEVSHHVRSTPLFGQSKHS